MTTIFPSASRTAPASSPSSAWTALRASRSTASSTTATGARSSTRRLRGGQRMPSTRSLAGDLRHLQHSGPERLRATPCGGLLRNPAGSGHLRGRIPPGTARRPRRTAAFATDPHPPGAPRAPTPSHAAPAGRSGSAGCEGPRRSFNVGQPPIDHFPLRLGRAWSRAAPRRSTARLLHDGPPMGSRPFREPVAAYLAPRARSRCEASQIMVVTGRSTRSI